MSRHLLIAGTGRAGTSFLVRYLTQMGLDTHLSRLGPNAIWDDIANAGLEDLPLDHSDDLPYVIKSPWSFQIMRDVLARGTLVFDAVILPLRDLTEAATSRVIVERQRLHEAIPLLADADTIWEQQGITPGGIVFSLNPIDQARLLAVGFHHLLEQLVRADIPVILLSFPRLIEDPDYLYGKLAAVLPKTVTVEIARAAHAATAEPSKVRVGRESKETVEGFAMGGPGSARLERAALRRSLADARHEAETAQTELANTRAMLAAAEDAFIGIAAERDKEAPQVRALQEALQREAGITAAAGQQLDDARAALDLTRGSLRTFLRHYLPRLRQHLFRR